MDGCLLKQYPRWWETFYTMCFNFLKTFFFIYHLNSFDILFAYRILRSWIMLVFHITYKSIWPSLSVLWCLIYIFKARTGESQLSCLSCIYRGFFSHLLQNLRKWVKCASFWICISHIVIQKVSDSKRYRIKFWRIKILQWKVIIKKITGYTVI